MLPFRNPLCRNELLSDACFSPLQKHPIAGCHLFSSHILLSCFIPSAAHLCDDILCFSSYLISFLHDTQCLMSVCWKTDQLSALYVGLRPIYQRA
jgi:hypothetical protein